MIYSGSNSTLSGTWSTQLHNLKWDNTYGVLNKSLRFTTDSFMIAHEQYYSWSDSTIKTSIDSFRITKITPDSFYYKPPSYYVGQRDRSYYYSISNGKLHLNDIDQYAATSNGYPVMLIKQ